MKKKYAHHRCRGQHWSNFQFILLSIVLGLYTFFIKSVSLRLTVSIYKISLTQRGLICIRYCISSFWQRWRLISDVSWSADAAFVRSLAAPMKHWCCYSFYVIFVCPVAVKARLASELSPRDSTCSWSRRRPQKVDKRMVLEHTHGLFIT